ncbi:hypothetical protein AAK967_08110 [Atopobiaceae bacterium 24-176]
MENKADPMPRRREAVRASELVSACVDTLAFGAKGTDKAGCVWNRIAGDSGRRHTRGLYVEEVEGADPVLHVYLDSSPLIQDFQTDRGLFEQRLRWSGFPVSSVVFQLSRKAGTPKVDPARPSGAALRPAPLPPLAPNEAQAVEEACSGLPDVVREQAAAAMGACLRRARAGSPENR